MTLNLLNCPACNSPLDATSINSNEPFNCLACGSAIVMTDWTKTGQIICVKCSTINANTNKFCISCEAVLQAGCPFCYTQNSITAATCKNCGANLQRIWKRQQIWLKQREKAELERKEALQTLAQNSEEHLTRLLLQLNEPENHPTAISGILIFGKDAVEPLIKLLNSEDPDARVGAAQALGDIGDKRAIPELINSINDSEVSVRFWIVDALGRLKADEAVYAISELLVDKSQKIRNLSKDVLIQIGTPDAIRILQEKSRRKWWLSL
ncbi:MAG: HEAT repeat domain-containing protein [Anaerolineales bacterium]|uniref:HEAT repeat domain-containing protein n=1 Tax=Candidatus Villigracilis proximus TaxID=3140683 RepID=UPI003136136A|nr:HEAT repeat domain-containing protein [Anaerolineales bacterium]